MVSVCFSSFCNTVFPFLQLKKGVFSCGEKSNGGGKQVCLAATLAICEIRTVSALQQVAEQGRVLLREAGAWQRRGEAGLAFLCWLDKASDTQVCAGGESERCMVPKVSYQLVMGWRGKVQAAWHPKGWEKEHWISQWVRGGLWWLDAVVLSLH